MFAALSSLTSLPVLILGIWAVAAPAGVYIWQKAEHYFEQRAAVAEARIHEKQVCEQRIAQIVLELDAASDERVMLAHDAATATKPTPAAPAEVGALCKADPYCRGAL